MVVRRGVNAGVFIGFLWPNLAKVIPTPESS
jgi:hypothetical protein